MKKLSLILIIGVLVYGCAGLQIDKSIMQYKKEASKVKIGDSKSKVLSILKPTQTDLPPRASKSPEAYKEGDKLIEIYYFRSLRQPDNLTTDDEFTPYIFTNGILTGIGWTVLGGAKTQGQAIQPAPQQRVIIQQQPVVSR